MDISYFTTWSPKRGESPQEIYVNQFKEVDAAEEMGFDTVWTASTPFGGVNPNPFVLSSAIASRTKRIKIGTAVHLLHNLKVPGEKYLTDVPEGGQIIVRRAGTAYRRAYSFDVMTSPDPIAVAESIAMVDHISNGRFIYGAGGDTAGDKARQDHFLEFLEVIKSIWTDEGDFSGFKGEFYNYPPAPEGMGVGVKPVQKPHPPILLPVDSQQSFEPMGRMGYKIAIRGNIDNQRGTTYGQEEGNNVLRDDVERYRKAWIDAGHPGNPGIGIRIPTHVSATKKEAEEFEEKVAADRAERAGGAQGATGLGHTDRQYTSLFGTADEVVEKMQDIQEFFGIDEFLCEVAMGNLLPREGVLQGMKVIADQVLPKLK